jgi:hypothetical protein
MSDKVELDQLLEVASGFTTVPMLLSADPDGRPRASAVTVDWDGESSARVRAGHRSVANAAERPLVSLLYPAPPGERFALLVNGEVTGTEADADDGQDARARRGGYVTVRATSAILHVVAGEHC